MGGYGGGYPPTSAGEAGASTPEVAKNKWETKIGGQSTERVRQQWPRQKED